MALTRYAKDSTSLPVSLADMKVHLRVDGTTEDGYITALILAGVDFIERETGVDYNQATWDLSLEDFPTTIELIKRPVASVTHVKYYNTANVLTTLDANKYHVVLPTNTTGFICPVYTQVWPSVYTRPDAVQVRYVTGGVYPTAFLQCLRLVVGAWYESREAIVKGTIVTALPLGADRLIEQLASGGYR